MPLRDIMHFLIFEWRLPVRSLLKKICSNCQLSVGSFLPRKWNRSAPYYWYSRSGTSREIKGSFALESLCVIQVEYCNSCQEALKIFHQFSTEKCLMKRKYHPEGTWHKNDVIPASIRRDVAVTSTWHFGTTCQLGKWQLNLTLQMGC